MNLPNFKVNIKNKHLNDIKMYNISGFIMLLDNLHLIFLQYYSISLAMSTSNHSHVGKYYFLRYRNFAYRI